MFDGFVGYDGVVLVDVQRTASIAQALGLTWFTNPEKPYGGAALGVKSAPWYEPSFPESARFAGPVITSMTPFLSSRSMRPVTPLARSGSALGRRYDQHREIVIAMTLIAADREAAVFGMQWLTNLLQFGSQCGETERDRVGFTLETWAWRPSARHGDHQRWMYEVHPIEGPTVLREVDMPSCAGSIIDVEVTLVAGNPGVYSNTYGFGQIQAGTAKDTYTDVRVEAAPGGSVPSGGRTYAQVRNLDGANDTTYAEVLTILYGYGIPATTEPSGGWTP